MEVKFTWDPEKAARNLLKHGISFETAVEVFADPNQIAAENYFVGDHTHHLGKKGTSI